MMRTLAVAVLFACGLSAQGLEFVKANDTKYEFQIPMRDGKRHFTSVYIPKDTRERTQSSSTAHRTASRPTVGTGPRRAYAGPIPQLLFEARAVHAGQDGESGVDHAGRGPLFPARASDHD